MDNLQTSCPECGTELPPGTLACPSCNRLLNAETLKKLSAEAQGAEQMGDLPAALTAWRDVLALLPPDTRQHAAVLQKIRALSDQVEDPAPTPASPSAWKKGAAGFGAIGLMLFKFKSVILIALTKGKFLLLGLTKIKTVLSMLVFMGVYWSIWGWKLAVGFGLSIYVHEMGHLWMLRRYGIRASAPMFIPGFGAYVRFHQYPVTEIEASRVALAGPFWGMAAAALCYGVYVATGNEFWGALAQLGAVVNLMNLIPLPFFDGGIGIRSLSRGQRLLLALAVGVMWYFTSRASGALDAPRQNVFLLVIGIVAAFRSASNDAPQRRDDFGLFQYVLLIMTLGALAAIEIPSLERLR